MENLEAFFRTIEYYIEQIQAEHKASSVKNRQHHAAIALQWVKGLQGATVQFTSQIVVDDKTTLTIQHELEKVISSLTDLEHYFSSMKDNSKNTQIKNHITADISISDIKNSYMHIRQQIDDR
jgi:DNA gyrase/topoisomerase IV subunit B